MNYSRIKEMEEREAELLERLKNTQAQVQRTEQNLEQKMRKGSVGQNNRSREER